MNENGRKKNNVSWVPAKDFKKLIRYAYIHKFH